MIGGYAIFSLAIFVYVVVIFLFPLIVISKLGKIVKELKELNQKASKIFNNGFEVIRKSK